MKNMIRNAQKLYTKTCQKAYATAVAVKTDISGSDTTEKVGMVVVAVLIVGLLATAATKFMPGLFENIFNKAGSSFNKIFGEAQNSYGT